VKHVEVGALRLSRVGLGAWALGGRHWGPVSEADVHATIEAAARSGVDWVDTAPIYGRDALVAEVARSCGMQIATKVGVREDGGHATSDLSRTHVRADAEASLRRLGVERIDLLQVHWPCERGTPLEETLDALESLRREGKVREVGLCNFDAASVRRAEVATLQAPYSMVRREIEGELLHAAGDAGTAVLAYEPLCRGLLTGKHRRLPRFDVGDHRREDRRFWAQGFARAQPTIAQLRRAAETRGTSMATLAVGWVLSRPGVGAVLVGARSAAQILETARAGNVEAPSPSDRT